MFDANTCLQILATNNPKTDTNLPHDPAKPGHYHVIANASERVFYVRIRNIPQLTNIASRLIGDGFAVANIIFEKKMLKTCECCTVGCSV